MSATAKVASKSRAIATDLDGAGPYRGRRLTFPERRQCALHLLSVPNDIIRYDPLDHTIAAIRLGRSATEIDPGIHSAWLDPIDWLDLGLPRGVPWRSYPIVSNPRYHVWRRLPVPAMSFAAPFTNAGSVPVCELVVTATMVVVHLPTGWNDSSLAGNDHAQEWIAHAYAVTDALPEGVNVVLLDPDGVPVGGDAKFDDLVARTAAWQRFLYSYAANFSAVAYRALGAAITAAGSDEGARELRRDVRMLAYHEFGADHRTSFERSRTKDPRSRANGLLHPLALQVLYGIRRRGGAALRRPITEGTTRDWQRDLVSDVMDQAAFWRGTGRYALRAIDYETAALVATALVGHGLVKPDGASIMLSRTGDAFLDVLPPDFEDPDMPSRWTSLPMGQPEKDSMDAWIARSFGKARRSVSGLPAWNGGEDA